MSESTPTTKESAVPPLTLADVEARLGELCEQAEVIGPDVILDNRNGSFTALWFQEKLAVIIEDEEELDAEVLAFPELKTEPADSAAPEAEAA